MRLISFEFVFLICTVLILAKKALSSYFSSFKSISKKFEIIIVFCKESAIIYLENILNR
ncbi:hypothetical protein A0G_1633 [Streptococcus iniae 9117]|nr:hypothetical protein A0G_1633 [Streptococcus iniae 9117]